jgi:hypothetical protein
MLKGGTLRFATYDSISNKTPPGIGRRLDSVVQRSLKEILHQNPKNSIPVAGVDAIEFAQSAGHTRFREIRVVEQPLVLAEAGCQACHEVTIRARE